MAVNQITFTIHISTEEFLEYYRGSAKNVVLILRNGQTIQFPANILQPFVSHDGVHGQFILRFDNQHKLVDIKRLSV